jgi:ATP/maltotriose-dependent transcriptional regulator MalT
LFLLYIVITDFHRYVNPVPFIALALLLRALAANLPRWKAKAPNLHT